MRRRWLMLAALVLGLSGLAVIAWLEPGAPGVTPRLTTLQPEHVQTLRLQRPNREDMALVRRDGAWQIAEPARAAASEFHVRQVTQLAVARSHRRYDRAELDASVVGLDPPRLRLELNDQVLEFGATDSVDGLRYVAVGDQVHLVRDEVTPLLEGGWWNFIDRHLVPGTWSIEEVESEHFHLAREGGVWRDGRSALSREQVGSLIADFRLASALVVREGRRRPDAEPELVLRFDNGEVRRFIAADSNGERRLKELNSGLLYVFDGAVRDYLLTGRAEPPAGDGDE